MEKVAPDADFTAPVWAVPHSLYSLALPRSFGVSLELVDSDGVWELSAKTEPRTLQSRETCATSSLPPRLSQPGYGHLALLLHHRQARIFQHSSTPPVHNFECPNASACMLVVLGGAWSYRAASTSIQDQAGKSWEGSGTMEARDEVRGGPKLEGREF